MDAQTIDITLEKFSLYYRSLSALGKEKFVYRLRSLSDQIFIDGIDITVTPEMEIILYSYFVQFGFGLQEYFPGNYQNIVLYPHSFLGRTGGNETAGKTYIQGKIALSWHHFSESHLQSNDGENLGFYHIAQAWVHALISGQINDPTFTGYFEACGKVVFLELIKNPYHPLVVANKNAVRQASFIDFFPALVEWFFEKPETLKSELPNCYAHVCTLLNQDPLATTDDYFFDKNKYQNKKGIKPIPKKIFASFAFRELNWLSTLPLISIMILPVFYNYYIRPSILLNNLSIAFIWLCLSTLLFFGFKKLVLQRQIFKNSFWWFLFVYVGASPIILFFAFVIGNQVVFSTDLKSHTINHVISVYGKRKSRGSSRGTTYLDHYIVSFNDHYLEDNQPAREFYPENYPMTPILEGNTVTYETGTCLWGYEVVLNKYVEEKPVPMPHIEL